VLDSAFPVAFDFRMFSRHSTARLTIAIKAALVTAILATLFTGCGDPKAMPPAIVVTFDLANYPIPAQLNTGAYVTVAAIVTNDSQNAGVRFSCTPTGTCGTFSPSTGTGSDVPVCYLALDSVPAQNPVTVTATSVTDPTKSASAMITIVSGLGNPCPPF
jgi:hypothetical protein